MRIAEIFYSLQGEGPAMGRPATFIRLSGCNLRCEGCDTQLLRWQDLPVSEICGRITGSRAIITGGEPTLQMRELEELIFLLHERNKEIHMESNGTNIIPDDLLSMIHYAVISPKQGSNFHLPYWAGKDNVHLKFVIGKASWCWTPQQVSAMSRSLPKDRIWIMAFGINQNLPEAKDAWDLALRLGVNYSDRLHIRMRRR